MNYGMDSCAYCSRNFFVRSTTRKNRTVFFQGPFHRAAPVAALLLLCAALLPSRAVWGEEIRIGTGSPVGVYYDVGRTICRILTRVDPMPDLTCISVATPGSTHNLEAVRTGELTIGLAQSDRQYDAVAGLNSFGAIGPDETLRSLFSLHTEPFTLVTRGDSGIMSLRDLSKRRVNIGNPGSGQRGTMDLVMQAMAWSKSDFALANELPASEQGLALCHGKIDAFVYTVGHPNRSIDKASRLCAARLVDVEGPEIEALIGAHPYFVKTEIPGQLYLVNPVPVRTFGVIATAVASDSLDEETAYQIVSRVFDNIDTLKDVHPGLGQLEPSSMTRDGLSAPLHAGAERYYRERGWLSAPPTPGTEPKPTAVSQ